MQKRILAKIILAAAVGMIAVDAVAIAPGLYIGMMMGPAQNGAGRTRAQVKPVTNPPQPVPPANSSSSIPPNTAAASPKSTQFGTRIYIGYKFNEYGSFEGGFTYFSGISYNIVQDPSLATPGSSIPLQAAAGTTARLRDIDIVGKLDYSYSDSIGIYAKAGIAAAYTTTPGALQPTPSRWVPAPTRSNPNGTKLISTGSNKYSSKLVPTFSLGVTYDIDPSWQTDLSWTRVMVGSAVKNMNFFAIGISYHFVDRYCGQFLCAE